MVPLFSFTIILLGQLAGAAPYVGNGEECHPQTICVDAVSPCGVIYGGCYNVCDDSAKPVPPPCPSTTSKKPTHTPTCKPPLTKTIEVTVTETVTACSKPPPPPPPPPPSSTSSTSTCDGSGQTVCVDYINECGIMYGGCFPDCKPWPTFTPPPCPTTKDA